MPSNLGIKTGSLFGIAYLYKEPNLRPQKGKKGPLGDLAIVM